VKKPSEAHCNVGMSAYSANISLAICNVNIIKYDDFECCETEKIMTSIPVVHDLTIVKLNLQKPKDVRSYENEGFC